jgi:hypothetical protein
MRSLLYAPDEEGGLIIAITSTPAGDEVLGKSAETLHHTLASNDTMKKW